MRRDLQCRLRVQSQRGRAGQTLPLLGLMVIVIILFVGMGIDVGFAYLTRASLAKGVDAACIAGVRNRSQGAQAAQTIAEDTFDMNYASSGVAGRQVAAPTRTAVFSTDANGNLLMDVNAAVDINTYFIRVLPSWRHMHIAAHGQATRQKVYVSLVLDRSGSMQGNEGWSALPPAVDTFVSFFDDTLDHMAVASFASHARLDLAMTQPFRTAVSNAVPRGFSAYNGGTFAQGGLTNGYVQLKKVIVAPGEKAVKVCVFFTDGLANIVQGTVQCPSSSVMNYGGYDAPIDCVDFVDPSNGKQLGTKQCASFCPTTTSFISAIDGAARAFTRVNVTADAQYRSIQLANDMRAAGVLVYSVGLGNAISQVFLQQIANDSASPTYDPNAPSGEALFAPTPADLQGVFEQLADKILLRITQ